MNLLIDTHCHLEHFTPDDLEQVINNAKNCGLKIMLSSGVNPDTNRKTLEIAKKYDIVKPALGVYPGLNDINIDEEIDFIEKNKDKIIAIGEIGLDYTEGKEEHLRQQILIFQKLIGLAKKMNKPVIVHSRKAEEDAINVLESSAHKKVLLHCFSGKKRLVKKASDLGYYFSIPTNVVRAQNFQIMAKEVNINQLFCETDSPYLSPFKDKRNEPAFVIESYKKIAELKGISLEEVINNVWVNFQKLFSYKKI